MTDDAVNPADIAAPDANVTPEVENVADPSPATADTGDTEKKPHWSTRRIDELTRNWRETERDRDHWRDLAMRTPAPPPKTESSVVEQPKTLADFGYDEGKFQSYIFEQAEKRAVTAARSELSAEKEREAAERRASSFKSRASEFAKTVEDYDSVVRNPQLDITKEMAEAIRDSEDGPALAYHLGKNPDIAEKIAQLSPVTAARELGKIEARLAYEREKAKEKPVVSKAPPPPPQLAAGESASKVSTTDPESDSLSDDEWVRAERKRINRKR
jgi:hypothetical protein